MKGLMSDVDSIDAKLAPLYAEKALVPASPWLDAVPPPRPTATLVTSPATGEPYVRLIPAKGEAPWLWVVRTLRDGQWTTEILPEGIRSHRLVGPGPIERVVVNAVDRVGNLSAPAVARSAHTTTPVVSKR
jgi:hypothetical protein